MAAGEDLVVWFYAGFFAGVLSSAVEEPSYATLFVFPLLFAVGEPPPVVALGFTMATGILGILNLLYQRFTMGGLVIHFEALRSVPVLLGLVLGVVLWLFLTWSVLKFIMAAALTATGVQLLFRRTLRVRGGKLRPLLNAFVGFTDALLGTAASFAVARVFVGEIEALIPVLRTVEATSSVALKQKVVIGGILAGLGAFLGQRAVSCGRSLLVTRIIAVTMIGAAVYVVFS
ncbi:MAG: hypothetical protein JHC20_06490 [Pyrobaculum sp.]|nr:hypothetical protein [Pyrobaculum sp.]